MKRHILPKVIILLAIVLSACSHEDTATVTIYTGLSQARMGIIDRVLSLISLSTPAKALPGPSDVTSMTVTVSAPDMLPLTIPIPVATGSVTFEVPAGNARTFTVVAKVMPQVGGNEYRKYGGITVANLSPGENKDLLIEMGNFINLDDYYYSLSAVSNNISIMFENMPTGILGFKIYESSDDTYIDEHLFLTTNNFYYNSNTIIIQNVNLNLNHYYHISVINKYGEGQIASQVIYYY